MAEEHADEPTIWLRPEPPCVCPDPGRACSCDDDGTTAEPREWSNPDKPTAPVRAPLPAAPADRG